MAQGDPLTVKAEDDDGVAREPHAYFVVLNSPGADPLPGVYLERPANTALGKHIDLLPIVVVCSNQDEALAVSQLNAKLIATLDDPTDVAEFMDAVTGSRLIRKVFMQEMTVPYYALKVAQETGIFHGFDWKTQVCPLTSYKKPLYKKFHMFGHALLWMLDKEALQPQFTIQRPLPRLFGTPPPRRTPSPVKRSGSQSPTKPPIPGGTASVRAPTPSREADAVPVSSPATPRRARFQTPLSPGSTFVSPSRARHAWPLGDNTLVVDVSDEERQGEDQPSSPLLDHLRQIVRPVTLPTGDFTPVFNLGANVDVWMSARRLPVEQQLCLLQAFVWSANLTEFVMTVGCPPFELPVVDAQYVWGLLANRVASS